MPRVGWSAIRKLGAVPNSRAAMIFWALPPESAPSGESGPEQAARQGRRCGQRGGGNQRSDRDKLGSGDSNQFGDGDHRGQCGGSNRCRQGDQCRNGNPRRPLSRAEKETRLMAGLFL